MQGSNLSESLSFESGSSGWQGGIEVTGTKQFGGHRITPFDGNKMGFLSPTGYGHNWNVPGKACNSLLRIFERPMALLEVQ